MDRDEKKLVGILPEPTQLQKVIQGDSGEDSEVAHPLHCAEESAQEAPEFGESNLPFMSIGTGCVPNASNKNVYDTFPQTTMPPFSGHAVPSSHVARPIGTLHMKGKIA